MLRTTISVEDLTNAHDDGVIETVSMSVSEARELFDEVPEEMQALILALNETYGNASVRDAPHYLILRVG